MASQNAATNGDGVTAYRTESASLMNDNKRRNDKQTEDQRPPFTVGSYALGIVMILCVAVIWTYASVLIQYIYEAEEYEKPYFMTYFNTNTFAVNNIGFLLLSSWRRLPWKNGERTSSLVIYDDALKRTFVSGASAPDNEPADGADVSRGGPQSEAERIRPYSKFRVFKCAAFFCPIWFLANSLFNASLAATSVSSVTVLSNTSAIWTFLLSLIFFNQKATWPCLLAMTMTIIGACLVGFSDAENTENETVGGDIYALLAAIFYAVYTSIIRWHASDDDRYSILMLFGFVGALNTILFWPLLLIFHFTDFETFQTPGGIQFALLLVNALVGTNLSEVLWARAVLLTSPTAATLGLTLTTPLAMTSDLLIKQKSFNAMYIIGAVLLTLGFICFNLEQQLMKLLKGSRSS
ncbi:hypothetical protein, conserved [Trypanosoma brucei brucei TREU927]|uniref:EamA domain-containing protein n=1 Tax=Trypanosoma brucei brucei (strain 927/4 GUTat10.1) TaxID=185431 RepID=Q580H7_TRYB2|nr:hypothetical protein, conserved [Trypanosoma brucei brucei TREU927]AAX79783.1 hypothetical protein, conserved [Trypanosoma brucei]AAZ12914.1 hypothetical protein, conserved [Trypanosoma brucei brucei TREU927]